jgi:hypothetical protein
LQRCAAQNPPLVDAPNFAGEYAIPPLPVGVDLKNVISSHRDEFSEEDPLDPNLANDSEIWLAILSDERLAAINAFEGPVRPALYNRVGRHAWWNGRNYWEVIAKC